MCIIHQLVTGNEQTIPQLFPILKKDLFTVFPQEATMIDNDGKPLNSDLDERCRNAQQYELDLQPVQQASDWPTISCPYHKHFVYECHYCNPD